LIVSGAPSHRELVVAVAEAAYRAGAEWVEHDVVDPRPTAARIRHGSETAIGALSPIAAAGRRALTRETTATHIDVVIGTEALHATGVTEQGRGVALVSDGVWQI